MEVDLPPAGEQRDELLLRLMGSPDFRQIDGLGGAASVTSKVAIIAPSSRDGVDVDYTFAQVSVDKPMVSYAGNCGNISSGVGPFSIESGLVKAEGPEATVRIFNTNTGKIMVEKVKIAGSQVNYDGDYTISGVPGTAAPIKIMVMDPAGTVFDSLLPTGNTVDFLDVPDFGRLEVSIVDAANPLVFARAADLGLTGKELPSDIDNKKALLALLERVRGSAAKLLGLVQNVSESALISPGVPKMTIIATPQNYVNTSGVVINGERIDLLIRMMSMQKTHPTCAMTGAMCIAAAAIIDDTLVYKTKRESTNPKQLRIGHPGGILEAGVDYQINGQGKIAIESVYGYRTARLLMKGIAYC